MRRYAIVIAAAAACLAFSAPARAFPAISADMGDADGPQVTNVAWQNVCRERMFMRRDRAGRLVALQAPVCLPVWVSRRYFSNGRYYADPGFTVPLD